MTTQSSALAQFDFQGHEVRVVTVDGEPWWVAADVAAVLQIARVHSAVRGLDDDEKGAHTMRTPGGDQQVSIISESGLYSLILRSRKPDAKRFRRWVTHEVLPAIRRTGRYQAEDSPASDLPAETAVIFRSVARAGLEALLALARTDPRDAAAVIAEALSRASPEQASSVLAGLRVDHDATPPAVPAQRAPSAPLWHLRIPEGAVSFSAMAEVLSCEFNRPDLSRDQLFTIARDARLLQPLAAPYSGNTLTDPRLSTLFVIRRIAGASHGWPCTHHYQPLALPPGLMIMRQLVAQDIDRGAL
ncbi:Bro-N domain-containing protein [Kitasatospora herbaricolor]|uniref:Bro-N domain-containing protein n=1 Tax=Kitasatospora herbaricolor TaxID=68217 RepID=A0ABZ1WA13_9ACTN|nr:Bro-N domain-containing protein [Kitasatospora herbaricolor]